MFENFSEMMLELFATSLWETVIMVGASGILGALVGIPLGVFLRLTDKGGILQNAPANTVVGGIVNAVRSTPFIILLVAIIPFTRPQQPITKSLIDEIVPQELPASVLARVRSLAARLAPGDSGQLLRLSYAGEQAYEPILSHLIRELGLDLSILHGQIDEIQEQTFGSLAVYASGSMARIGAAIDYLRAQGVVVQTVEVTG